MSTDTANDLPWRMRKTLRPGRCSVYGCRNPSRHAKGASPRACLCSRHAMQIWRKENRELAHFAQIKDRARQRSQVFELTIEQYRALINGTGYTEQRGRKAFSLHLDRIDPLLGYTMDNVRVLGASDNCRKGATTDKERRAEFIRQKINGGSKADAEEKDENCPF